MDDKHAEKREAKRFKNRHKMVVQGKGYVAVNVAAIQKGAKTK